MLSVVLLSLAAAQLASAQTFQRLGTCPTLGCIFPPDQTSFLAGAYFDIRNEIHAPVNGSEAFRNGIPDKNFEFWLKHEDDKELTKVTDYFSVQDSPLETWTFDWYEDLFAEEAERPSIVNVASKAYRKLALYKPGKYEAVLKYYDGYQTKACWYVREPAKERKAKNVILFIGDGMTTAMITAARLLAHKSINGEYQSLMQMDQMEAYGSQMTHSIDSFITDSANSATALNGGKKSSVNALNVFVDSNPDPYSDLRFESLGELFRRRIGGPIGMVSTAYIADATPAAVCAHTPLRSEYARIVQQYLEGPGNATIQPFGPGCLQPDVIFGGGAEQFIAGEDSPNGEDYYKAFQNAGYNVVYNNSQLQQTDDHTKTLGIFSIGNLNVWLDRNVYTNTLQGNGNDPTGNGQDTTDQPGLKEMTAKAIDILSSRSKKDGDKGFFLMSEAASIDKQMHALDYQRALGDVLELDDTVRHTLKHLKDIGELEDTLVIVTADHGHGFDVYGGADTHYLQAKETDAEKRSAVGIYEQSGLSGYTVTNGSLPTNQTVVEGPFGKNFPVNWEPRYAIAAGLAATVDHREAFLTNTTAARELFNSERGPDGDLIANVDDQPGGFTQTGNLPPTSNSGVHSLTDVPVYASGPGSEMFRGVYNSIDIFYKIADALMLGRTDNTE